MPTTLAQRRAWVFDLDGTLTEAVHDYAAMKRQLGLPAHLPLLEALDGLPGPERHHAEQAIEAWEWTHAETARPALGAAALLDRLVDEGARVGVLTRNLREVALRTLEVIGLAHRFDPQDVLGRRDAPPKPAPDGIHRLLARWGAAAVDAVMVGDSVHDALAGRAAGVLTVLVHPEAPHAFAAAVDVHAPDHTALGHARLRATP